MLVITWRKLLVFGFHQKLSVRARTREKIREYRKKKVLEEVVAYIQNLPEAPRGTAEKLVREDRDSH